MGDQLPKPEHLGPGKVIDNMQCAYPAYERLMAIKGGKLWAMYQAVECITDQLCVCVYSVCAYVCGQFVMGNIQDQYIVIYSIAK